MMRFDDQSLGHIAVAQNADAIGRSIGQSRLPQRLLIDGGAVGKGFIQIAHVDHEIAMGPSGVTEAALGDAAKERHLAAFKCALGHIGAGAGPLAFAAAGSRLAVTAARAPAHALLPL